MGVWRQGCVAAGGTRARTGIYDEGETDATDATDERAPALQHQCTTEATEATGQGRWTIELAIRGRRLNVGIIALNLTCIPGRMSSVASVASVVPFAVDEQPSPPSTLRPPRPHMARPLLSCFEASHRRYPETGPLQSALVNGRPGPRRRSLSASYHPCDERLRVFQTDRWRAGARIRRVCAGHHRPPGRAGVDNAYVVRRS